MKGKIKNTVWIIYLKLLRLYGSFILKCQVKHLQAVFYNAYIQTFSLFPENKLNYNIQLSRATRNRLFDLPAPESEKDLSSDEIEALCTVLKSDSWVLNTVSNYYLLEAFYYTFGSFTGLRKAKAEEALGKAWLYIPDVSAISYDNVGLINKNIRKELKQLRKDIRLLNSERIGIEKLKIIQPIEVTASHILFFISLFSSLFLVSGFIYNKIFFSHFNVQVGDFFTLADYMASSIDALTATAISSVLGVLFFFWGISSGLSQELYSEQFETDRRDEGYFIPIMILMSAVAIVISYKTGQLLSIALYPLVFFVAFHMFYRLPIWKYIKNKSAIEAVLVAIIFFGLFLGFRIKDNLELVNKPEYNSPYVLNFKKEYSHYSGYTYIDSNTNFVFLLDKQRKIMEVLPKAAIKSFRSRR